MQVPAMETTSGSRPGGAQSAWRAWFQDEVPAWSHQPVCFPGRSYVDDTLWVTNYDCMTLVYPRIILCSPVQYDTLLFT